jgi:hypothetical protein
MSEDIVAQASAESPPESPAEPADALPAQSPIEPPAPKKKGRPSGAKDKAPRARKKVTIATEFLEPQTSAKIETPMPAPVQNSEAPAQALPKIETPVQEIELPPSPRTVLRESAKHILELRGHANATRKTHLGNLYAHRLASYKM